jgi:hypothetical protein
VLSAEDKPGSSRKRAVQQALEVTLIARSATGDYLSVEEMKKLLSRDQTSFQDSTGYVVSIWSDNSIIICGIDYFSTE